jgi:3-deoxy-D-manno-octulosonic-acid transferase
MENFGAVVTRWREADAAVQVQDERELASQMGKLLADPERRETLARRAREIVAAHSGATRRTALAVLDLQS